MELAVVEVEELGRRVGNAMMCSRPTNRLDGLANPAFGLRWPLFGVSSARIT